MGTRLYPIKQLETMGGTIVELLTGTPVGSWAHYLRNSKLAELMVTSKVPYTCEEVGLDPDDQFAVDQRMLVRQKFIYGIQNVDIIDSFKTFGWGKLKRETCQVLINAGHVETEDGQEYVPSYGSTIDPETCANALCCQDFDTYYGIVSLLYVNDTEPTNHEVGEWIVSKLGGLCWN